MEPITFEQAMERIAWNVKRNSAVEVHDNMTSNYSGSSRVEFFDCEDGRCILAWDNFGMVLSNKYSYSFEEDEYTDDIAVSVEIFGDDGAKVSLVGCGLTFLLPVTKKYTMGYKRPFNHKA